VRCATLNGAQAVKVNAGAIEVGRLADLIALDCRYHNDDSSSGDVHAATDDDDTNHVKNLRSRRAAVSLRSL
jgi:cytosine/adenosine deaminase-related metal-dependent hydrolase